MAKSRKERRSRRQSGASSKIEMDDAPLTSSPFAGLCALTPSPSAAPPSPVPPSPVPVELPARADERAPSAESSAGEWLLDDARLIVRRQRKGQGGKTVTCIEGFRCAPPRAILQQIKRELGCSARVMGDPPILLLGLSEHQRAASWLRDAGARQVILGN